MNRRQFTARLGAVATLPAIPVKAIASVPVASGAIPPAARFWAIYMSHLHGTCSADALRTMTGVDTVTAQGYLSRMLSDGVLKPTRFGASLVHAHTKPASNQKSLKQRLEKFNASKSDEQPELIEQAPVDDTPEETPEQKEADHEQTSI